MRSSFASVDAPRDAQERRKLEDQGKRIIAVPAKKDKEEKNPQLIVTLVIGQEDSNIEEETRRLVEGEGAVLYYHIYSVGWDQTHRSMFWVSENSYKFSILAVRKWQANESSVKHIYHGMR